MECGFCVWSSARVMRGLWSDVAAWSVKNGDAEKSPAEGVKEVEGVLSEDHGCEVDGQALKWMY